MLGVRGGSAGHWTPDNRNTTETLWRPSLGSGGGGGAWLCSDIASTPLPPPEPRAAERQRGVRGHTSVMILGRGTFMGPTTVLRQGRVRMVNMRYLMWREISH